VVTSTEEDRDSWIVESLHAPTWLHLPIDHSIEPYRSSSLVAVDSVLLVENLGGICLVCQI
jgi:hypothetical protein